MQNVTYLGTFCDYYARVDTEPIDSCFKTVCCIYLFGVLSYILLVFTFFHILCIHVWDEVVNLLKIKCKDSDGSKQLY